MKFIGILMIIISSACIGINEANKLRLKCDITEQIISMIKQIKIQMNYCVPTTREILSNLCSNNRFNYLTFINKCFDQYDEYAFDTLWEQSINKSQLIISKEDIASLISFGTALGTTDVDGQIELCNTYIEKFQVSLKSYIETKEKKSKLYIAFGVLMGIGTSIILI